jgi:cell division protein FtsW
MLERTDTSILGRWWWTVDKQLLGATFLLMALGILFIVAASPAVADRIEASSSQMFTLHHLMMLPVAIGLMLGLSLLEKKGLARVAVLGLLGVFGALILTLIAGEEIKGARRWVSLGFFSLQASEFAKPFLAVSVAWFLARGRENPRVRGKTLAMLLFGLTLFLIILQPDLGMSVVITLGFFTQVFLAGLRWRWIVMLCLLAVLGLVGAYLLLPHVSSRVDRFLETDAGDTYQITQSLRAYRNGGFFGVGPGEGTIKMVLPDAHADFVFAVVGEEFGAIVCLFVLGLIGYIVLRVWRCCYYENDLFFIWAGAGLSVQMALQSFVNMASSLALIPTKGMTLPFVSYGGSSLLASSVVMGFLLAMTRKRPSLGGPHHA